MKPNFWLKITLAVECVFTNVGKFSTLTLQVRANKDILFYKCEKVSDDFISNGTNFLSQRFVKLFMIILMMMATIKPLS